MESGEEDIDDEDGTEWKSSFTELQTNNTSDACGANRFSKTPHRVIVHFDLDCFYAQVEMLRNPALRNVPLGIQQKNIIVTCNYVARDHGVTKLMYVTDAKEKCPQLVMVKGEDLTHYRDMSYKVTELLMSYCPLVERLGFDENFIDVTEMIDNRLTGTSESSGYSFKGHVYNHAGEDVKASDDPRLALGSHIAAELRAAIHSKLGLTGCAGIATNKLLAKLVSGTFKPNEQTTLLTEHLTDIMSCLSGLRKVPGVGHQTSKRLQALGLVSVQDLQVCPMTDLVREFGAPSAQRLQNLALGVDDSPVTPTGPPQSLSDEDSFKKMSLTKEVSQKIQDLLSSLVERKRKPAVSISLDSPSMISLVDGFLNCPQPSYETQIEMHKDGRQPQTFRLTIRRYSATNKWFSRESRQCPIPNHVGQKITSGSTDALAQLVTIAMKLFHKMVAVGTAFHLTLVNVCFSNLQSRGARVDGTASIISFFTSPGKTHSSLQNQSDLSPSGNSHLVYRGFGCDLEEQSSSGNMSAQDALQSTALAESSPSANRKPQGLSPNQGDLVPLCQQEVTRSTMDAIKRNSTQELRCRLPPDIDLEVFRLLPEDIRKELLSPAYTNSPRDFPISTGDQPATGEMLATTLQHLPKKNPPQPCPTEYRPVPREHAESHHFQDGKEATMGFVSCDKPTSARHQLPPGPSTLPTGAVTESRTSMESQSSDCGFPVDVDPTVFSDCGFPVDVDPTVFSELPPNVQRELRSEWKLRRPVLKAPSSKKQGRNCLSKDRKAAHKGSQANSLLNYFKPN